MGCRVKSKAEKKYLERLAWTMSVYLVVVFLTTILVRHGHVTGWMLYVVAVAPCIPILRMIHVLALYVQEETDEFQRLLAVRSILCGGAAMLVVAAFSDFLRSYTKIGDLPPFTMFMVFWVVFGIAQVVQKLMTRAVDDE